MARREKKSGISLKVVVPVACVIVVGVTFFMLHDIQKRIEKMDIQNVNDDENIATNETIEENNIEENTILNTVQNNTENKVVNTSSNTNTNSNTTLNSSKNSVKSNSTSNPGITDKKQKAIELVKNTWGADDTVDYVFDYVNENGEYVIAVKDRISATVKYYFRVNLETGNVEMD